MTLPDNIYLKTWIDGPTPGYLQDLKLKFKTFDKHKYIF